MPLWAYLFSREVKKEVDLLDDRVIILELEIKELKRKLERNGIK